jgi:hypothetical protein
VRNERRSPAGVAAAVLAAGAAGFCPSAAVADPESAAAKLTASGAWAYVDGEGKVRASGSFIGVPPDSVLTPRALRERNAFDFKTDDPVLGCGEPGMPRALTAASPMTFSFEGAMLIIKYESMDVARVVRMDRHIVPGGAPRTPNGYAVGYWVGDSLIVETSHVDGRIQDLQGTPKSEQARFLERYTVEDADGETRLKLELTMIDDEIFAKPYTWHLDFVHKPDWSLLEYACEERPVELTPGVVPE